MPTPRPPLQILVFGDLENDPDATVFVAALEAAISGGCRGGNYVPLTDDLGIQILRFGVDEISGKNVVPADSPDKLLGGFQHTVAIALISAGWIGSGEAEFWSWLGTCWEEIRQGEGVNRVLPVLLDERSGRSFGEKHAALSAMQTTHAHELGESAIRPAMFALQVLHECRLAIALRLSASPGRGHGFLRLFISHAKLDGLPMAQALNYQIQQIPWLKSFYDADDLTSGGDWKKELEAAAGSSIVVILRSEIYDSRYWCQQEVLWSEEYATPVILVELRTGMNHPVAVLPFERAPVVRVSDGNLFRIVFVAVREGLRFLHFMARVEEMKRTAALPSNAKLRVFCAAPAMSALLRACVEIRKNPPAAGVPSIILYPDPALRTGMREAAEALVANQAPGTQLLTPLTMATNAAISSP